MQWTGKWKSNSLYQSINITFKPLVKEYFTFQLPLIANALKKITVTVIVTITRSLRDLRQ